MKAIIYSEYGGPDVLHLQETEKPFPKSNEVLIRVHAVSVNYGDIIARNFKNIRAGEFNMLALFRILARFGFGFSKPKRQILGNTFAGEVEMIGNGVKQFRPGEQVFGYTGETMGAYAEYLCIPEDGILALKPSHMTYEEASTVPYGATMALCLLRKVNIQKGQRVIVIGASGAIGSAAVQLASHYFGAEVTGVCGTQGMEYVKNLGAAKVIDYKKEDFTRNGESYDLIFDILGKESFSKYRASLKHKGIYMPVSFKTAKLLQMLQTSIGGGKRVICALATPKQDDLVLIRKFLEDRKLKPVVDKSFPLEKAAEAHKYVEAGNKKGNVVLKV
ncbi:MAG: NAD(P)-dependent alcohol dehydrogenase [Bacteroidales bacterium]|nr:NAD(P)-dependent alcohol dehydrogenase [Bacteroidales bacterium]